VVLLKQKAPRYFIGKQGKLFIVIAHSDLDMTGESQPIEVNSWMLVQEQNDHKSAVTLREAIVTDITANTLVEFARHHAKQYGNLFCTRVGHKIGKPVGVDSYGNVVGWEEKISVLGIKFIN
jgi:hypothetical protein